MPAFGYSRPCSKKKNNKEARYCSSESATAENPRKLIF
jgi:hypothetical protein